MIKITPLLLGLMALTAANSNAQQEDSPKLLVGIVVDQMCYEYLYRYKDKFSKGGLVKLMDNGANCRNVNYNYVPTYTGPGHASIYTGTTPSNHGIVANHWYDRDVARSINCVEDSNYTSLGTHSTAGSCSPKNLKSNTITDQLKLTYPNAKVISLSIKNRGAILPGGHLSDGSYWYDYTTGNMITSTFFEEKLPSWVNAFNEMRYPQSYMNGFWETLYDISTYTESGPDDSKYEVVLPGKTTPTFPYNLAEMAMVENYSATSLFPVTPFADSYLTDFAIAALQAENLGQDDQTDMLCISYSSPDIIGHAFGPYSVEVEDTYLRLDKDIEKLINALEDHVGKKDFVLFITADHAVVPVPQQLKDQNLPGGYLFVDTNMYDLKQDMIHKYGQNLIDHQENLNIYLDHDSIALLGFEVSEVCDFIVSRVAEWEGVKRVFTGGQLYNSNATDPWFNMVRNGYHHAESGDVLFILEPGYLAESEDSERARQGTSHGSAYSYDTHVPLIWYGDKIPKGEVFRNINITDITATLTHFLYLQQVNALTGEPILEVLGE